MIFERRFLLGALPLLLLVPLACSGDEDDPEKFSEHYEIGQLNASYGAFAEDGRLKVYAALLGNGGGFVRLRGGDTFEVTIDGARAETNERLLESKVHYIADVPAPDGETEVAITFVRGLERVTRKIRLYSAFSVPNPPTTAKLGGAVDIDVDPRPDLSKWPGFFGPSLVGKAEIIGQCIGTQQLDLCSKDSPAGKCTQAYPLSLDTTKLLSFANITGCPTTVKIRLVSSPSEYESTGPAKAAFKGGGFDGHRGVALALQLLPPDQPR